MVGGQLPEGMTAQRLVRALIVLLEAHEAAAKDERVRGA